MVSSTLWPHFTPGKDLVSILQEVGWAPGPVLIVGKSPPHRDSIPDRRARSQSLYRLSYPAHLYIYIYIYIYFKLIQLFSSTVLGLELRRVFSVPFSAGNIPLCRGQQVACELRVEFACCSCSAADTVQPPPSYCDLVIRVSYPAIVSSRTKRRPPINPVQNRFVLQQSVKSPVYDCAWSDCC